MLLTALQNWIVSNCSYSGLSFLSSAGFLLFALPMQQHQARETFLLDCCADEDFLYCFCWMWKQNEEGAVLM
jgi:hypothetical protein